MALLAACGAPKPDTGTTATTADTVAQASKDVNWPGYYTGTLPCMDCKGIGTQLWVRSDSTFVLQQHFLGRDSLRIGSFGQWHVVEGLLTVGSGPDKPEFWRPTEKGLLNVDEMGEAFAGEVNYTLDKLADEINDEVPAMRVWGVYRLSEGSQTFQPCGAKTPWPAGMGLGYAEEEGEAIEPAPDLAADYKKAGNKPGTAWPIEVVGHLGMGPAAEGDGADEYFYVHKLIGPVDPCP
jgi:hypothetical protein